MRGLPDEMIVYRRVNGCTMEMGTEGANPRANLDSLFSTEPLRRDPRSSALTSIFPVYTSGFRIRRGKHHSRTEGWPSG